MAFDTIIKGGRVVDGSGLPMRVADVGIKAGMITDVGRLAGARRTIAADGLVVMPGIIDVHTHYAPQLTFEPLGTSSCYHGVTSVVAGNCGYSIAPCRPADRAWLTEFFAKVEGMSPSVLRSGLPWDWETFPSLLEVLDRRLGINAAIYIGHSALRRYVMGDAASERDATPEERARMADHVREAMRAGAAGFSSSQAPTHVDQANRPVPSPCASFEEVAGPSARSRPPNGSRASATRASGSRPARASTIPTPTGQRDRPSHPRACRRSSSAARPPTRARSGRVSPRSPASAGFIPPTSCASSPPRTTSRPSSSGTVRARRGLRRTPRRSGNRTRASAP